MKLEKKYIKHIFGMGSLNIENYNNNSFYSYLQKNDLVYTKSIMLNQLDTRWCVQHAENHPARTKHKDDY